MKRRNFFNAAIAVAAWFHLPQPTVAQSTDKQQTENTQHEFKPGDRVPVSGIYDVIHDKVDGDDHALPHQVTATRGRTFPPCRLCREELRYRLHRPVEHVQEHNDFKK
jgi:hypothetical protein